AQVGEVDRDRDRSIPGKGIEIFQRALDLRIPRKRAPRPGQHGTVAVQLRKGEERAPRRLRELLRGRAQSRQVFRLPHLVEVRLELGAHASAAADRPEDRNVPDIEARSRDAARRERLPEQTLYLDVALNPGVAVDLRADLQRLARGVE